LGKRGKNRWGKVKKEQGKTGGIADQHVEMKKAEKNDQKVKPFKAEKKPKTKKNSCMRVARRTGKRENKNGGEKKGEISKGDGLKRGFTSLRCKGSGQNLRGNREMEKDDSLLERDLAYL